MGLSTNKRQEINVSTEVVDLDKLANETMASLEKQGGLFGSAIKFAGKHLLPWSGLGKKVVETGEQTMAKKVAGVAGKAMVGGFAASAVVDGAGKMGSAVADGARPLNTESLLAKPQDMNFNS